MTRKKKVKRNVGDVICVPLRDGRSAAFGLLLAEPLVAFFDLVAMVGEAPDVQEIVKAPVAFRIWVMNQPITDGAWPVLGHVSIPAALAVAPWFFKRDAISGRVTVGRSGAEEVEPAPGQAEKLERASVWSAVHVLDRLEDHFAGRPNKWVESMRLKNAIRN